MRGYLSNKQHMTARHIDCLVGIYMLSSGNYHTISHKRLRTESCACSNGMGSSREQ